MLIAMDSSELLRLQLAQKLECTRNNICIGPPGVTGAVGPIGPTGPIGPSGYQKMFTIYLDFSSGSAIKRVYIPPGLSTSPSLAAGGVFSANVGTNLIFLGTENITIKNTSYAVPIGLSATGYTASSYWTLSAYSILGGGGITWQNTVDNDLNLVGITPSRINGGNISNYPTNGTLSGWLGTLTLYYL